MSKPKKKSARKGEPLWVRFMDMNSGGGPKIGGYDNILIEADTKEEGRAIFTRLFGRDPDHVTCGCCGRDYSVNEPTTLAQATAFDRKCDYDRDAEAYVERVNPMYAAYGVPMLTLDEYIALPGVRLVPRSEWRKTVAS